MSLKNGVMNGINSATGQSLMFVDDGFNRLHVVAFDRLCRKTKKTTDDLVVDVTTQE